MPSNIVTSLSVDPALEIDDSYRMDDEDRRLIDDQILGCERHLVESLIRGRHATWFTLSGSSASVAAGDAVCLSSDSAGTVTKAVSSALAHVPTAMGVALYAAPASGNVLVVLSGALPPGVTGLATGTPGFVRVNQTTARLEVVTTMSVSDVIVGMIDNAGWMQVCSIATGLFNSPTITGNVLNQGTTGYVLSITGEFTSVGAVTDEVAAFTIPDECCVRSDFTCVMKAVGVVAKAGSVDGKATHYRSGGGSPTIIGSIEYGTAQFSASSDGVVLFIVGNAVKVIVTSSDSDNRNWRVEFRVAVTFAT